MSFWQPSRGFKRVRNIGRSDSSRRRTLRPRFEALEPRTVLSVSIAPLPNAVLAAGAPLNVALHAQDPSREILYYEVSSSNPDVTPTLLDPYVNRAVRFSVNYTGDPANPNDDFGGDMVFALFEQWAPNTTERFTQLVNSGGPDGTPFYDGLTFHQVFQNATIQGGDPNGDGSGGSGVQFDDEFHPELQFTSSGILAMANTGSDTNDSQFFVTSAPYRSGDYRYTIFGFLTSGDDIRQKIAAVPVDANRHPLFPVQIRSASVEIDDLNSVLHLSAPTGAAGTSTITVKAMGMGEDDQVKALATQSFNVTVQADAANSPPYIGALDEVLYGTANTPINFDVPGIDAEGDPIFYSGEVSPANGKLTLALNSSTGHATLTPANGATGVFKVSLHVGASSSATGSALDSQDVYVYITGASGNTAPALIAAAPSLGAISAGASKTIDLASMIDNGAGTTTLLDLQTTDCGIAVVGVAGDGTWAYSLDGSGFQPVGAVAANSALLLPRTAKLRYTSNGSGSEEATVTYRAWDASAGSVGAKADTTTNGGSTAFSTDTDTATLTVVGSNAAPILTAAQPSLGRTSEIAEATVNLASILNAGTGTTTVADSDLQDPVGIALTGVSGRGTWSYSLDGTTFQPVGSVAATAALLLPRTAQVRYTPNGSGSETATMTYRAWDATTGTAGGKVDATANGGSTAFSVATDTASLNVVKLTRPVIRLPGGGGSNSVVVFRAGENLRVQTSQGKILLDQPLFALGSLTIQGRANKSDTVTVDFAKGGEFSIPGGIVFDGKSGRPADTLVLRGTSGADVFKTAGGFATIGSLKVRVSGIEQLTLNGGAGDDTYQVSALNTARTVIFDNGGGDLLDFSQAARGVAINLAKSAGQAQRVFASNSRTLALRGTIENAIGTNAADTIVGNAAANRIEGRGGNDTIRGGAGNDTIFGGLGDDRLFGEAGDDRLEGELGNDRLDGGPGNNVIVQ